MPVRVGLAKPPWQDGFASKGVEVAHHPVVKGDDGGKGRGADGDVEDRDQPPSHEMAREIEVRPRRVGNVAERAGRVLPAAPSDSQFTLPLPFTS